jgi:hypothetical protein
MRIWLLILSIYSVSAYADKPTFKNCEANLCEALLTKLSKGIPHFVEQINTGKTLKIHHDKVDTIEQNGNLFKVWSYDSGYYHIKYKCFEGVPCMFTWNGTRTIH